MQSQLNRLGMCLALALIACLFQAAGAGAQTAATIVGDATDSSGAAIPGVTVTVIHEGTGVERQVTTNEAGQYRVTPLNPGTYTIQVELSGFKRQVRSGVVLEVSAVLEVDFTLQIGEVTETIEVTSVTPVLQTEEASVGNVVTSQDLERMPVNQRNYTRLILMMPGTSSVTRSQQRGTGTSGTALYSVNGGRPQDNNFTLDGVDSNMMMMNSPGMSPPMDAIQEFKVATNTGSEFGRSMGANVNMVMKSGTRDLHGTLYEYLRNDKFDANEFFANRSGLGKTPFRLNQYGVSVGGPVMLPKANLRDKMFWFFAWEGFRRRRGSALLGSVPPADFRAGNFSSLLTQSSPIYLRDPLLSGNCDANDRTACFPNNIIPQGRINRAIPTALELVVPLPNRPGPIQNLVSNASQANDRDLFNVRWDYNLNPKDSVFFRWSRQKAGLFNPNAIPTVADTSRFDVINYGGSWVHIFSPTTTAEFGFGTNQPQDPNVGTKPVTRAEYFDRTGIQMYQREVFSDPLVNITLGSYSIPSASGGDSGDKVWQGRGNLSFIRGKHSLKIGGQYHYRNFFTNTANPMNGDAIFNGQITNFPMADALLGYPSEVRRGQGNTLTDSIGHFMLGHIQDDWRVSSNLTINFGLMYQFGTRPYDKTDRLGNLWVHLDPATGKVVGDLMWATTNPEPDPVTGRRNEPARTFGFGRALVQNDYNDLAPRMGIAYRLGSKTVIRSGFGVFYNSTFVQELQDLRKFWPFTVQQVFSPNRGGLDLSITDPGPSFESTAAIGGWPQNPENRSPYSMQWNFFIQRELMNDMSLDIGYVGSGQPQADRLLALQQRADARSRCDRAAPFVAGVWRPRRRLEPVQRHLQQSAGHVAESASRSGLQFNLNYTFQKALDGQSSLAEVKVQNPFDRRQDYSRSSWDINHVFNFSYLYELPFGKGRKFGANWGTATDLLLGGWALEGITRLESGPPLLISTGIDRANTGRSTQRPNLVGDPNDGPKTPDEWFNTKAFVLPPLYSFGNAGQYITNADGIISYRRGRGQEVQDS